MDCRIRLDVITVEIFDNVWVLQLRQNAKFRRQLLFLFLRHAMIGYLFADKDLKGAMHISVPETQ